MKERFKLMFPKRIILMYITEISGHHSATLAVEKAIKTISPETEILNINAFNYTNPISEKVINRLYMTVIKKTPQVWDYLYDNPDVVNLLENIKKTIHKFNSSKLKDLFDEFKPDVVACTQAFPCGMVADFKKIYNTPLPLVAILTDYIPHSYWIYDTVDYYVVPSDEVGRRLQQKGVASNRIKPFGIPHDLKFKEVTDKEKFLRQLNLDSAIPTVLIMGGGQGLGPIKTIVASLEKVTKDIQEIVICGNNTKLYNTLTKSLKKYRKKIVPFGWADNINELMDISDIVITKPGGITTAEALAKNLPILIIKPIPGQEANNTAYLTKEGAALKVDALENTNVIVEDLLTDAQKLNSLRAAALRISKPNASFDIANLLLDIK